MAKGYHFIIIKEKQEKVLLHIMAKALSDAGKEVLMIDADPQCSLTKLSLNLNNNKRISC